MCKKIIRANYKLAIGEILTEAAKVLVVDDHPLFRAALGPALIKAKFDTQNIHSRSCIAHSLESMKKAKYDLVLLDLNLPDSRGFEGFSKIRAADEDVPIIVVSATESQPAFSTAKSLGASGYIPKSSTLTCLLYTSPSPRDLSTSRMPSSA